MWRDVRSGHGALPSLDPQPHTREYRGGGPEAYDLHILDLQMRGGYQRPGLKPSICQ